MGAATAEVCLQQARERCSVLPPDLFAIAKPALRVPAVEMPSVSGS